MKYKVGFIGCDQNKKSEVYPAQGWIVSLGAEEEEEHIKKDFYELWYFENFNDSKKYTLDSNIYSSIPIEIDDF